jgi:hypothetical protein
MKAKTWNKTYPLSWSSIALFTGKYAGQYKTLEQCKEEWYKKYVLLEPLPFTPREKARMKLGTDVGKRLEVDPTYLPQVPRYGKDEYKFLVKLDKNITLTGYADTFDHITCKRLGERKTGAKWTKKLVDEHGQITLYCLMNYIQNKIRPEDTDIHLCWLPTEEIEHADFHYEFKLVDNIEKNIKIFKTKRTMFEILEFAGFIKDTYAEMELFCKEKDAILNK